LPRWIAYHKSPIADPYKSAIAQVEDRSNDFLAAYDGFKFKGAIPVIFAIDEISVKKGLTAFTPSLQWDW